MVGLIHCPETLVRNYHSFLLTPWSRVLLEKLTGSAASQEIPHISDGNVIFYLCRLFQEHN